MKERQIHLDIVKILSCFLVIVNHTNSRIFRPIEPSITWFASLTYFFVSKPAVPLFLMCSGAVLLGREDSYHRWLSRLFRMIATLFIFSFLYYFSFQKKEPLSLIAITRFFLMTISRHATTAYWYLYLYTAILLMLPFLQKMVKNFKKEDFRWFIAIFVVMMGCFPILFHYLNFFLVPAVMEKGVMFNVNFTGSIFSIYIGLFVAGYYFNGAQVKRKFFVIALAIYFGLLIVQVLLTYGEYIINPASYLFFDGRTLATITLSSFALFYIVKCISSRISYSQSAENMISSISGCTFGIYLLSDFFISCLAPMYNQLSKWMSVMLAMVLFQLLVFLIGFIATFVLKKIPLISKLL